MKKAAGKDDAQNNHDLVNLTKHDYSETNEASKSINSGQFEFDFVRPQSKTLKFDTLRPKSQNVSSRSTRPRELQPIIGQNK